MTLAVYQSYSNNNYKLFKTTIENHIDYCNKNQYSLILDNTSYSVFFNVVKMKQLLDVFDIVVTIGSDCVFTNFDKRFQNFISKQKTVGICLEGGFNSYTNGEITILKKDIKTGNYLNIINQQQLNNPNIRWGYQGCMNKLCKQKRMPNYVELIKPGLVQSYYFYDKYTDPWIKALKKDCSWKQGDFICHCLGCSGQDKLSRCELILNKIKTE